MGKMYLYEKTFVLGLLSLSTWINYANRSVSPSEMGRDVCVGGGVDRVNFVLICVFIWTAHCYLDPCIFMYYSNVLSVLFFSLGKLNRSRFAFFSVHQNTVP